MSLLLGSQIVNDAITKFAVGKTQVNQPEIHIRRIDAAEGRAREFTALCRSIVF